MITRTQTTQDDNNLVLTMALVKEHLKVTQTKEDNVIGIYLSSAQRVVENKTGRAVGTQKFIMYLDSFCDVVFDASSNDAIEKVEYYPEGGDSLVELPDTSFSLIECGVDQLKICFADSLPALADRTDAVKVTVTRGYAAVDCPDPIKSAMLLLVSDSYERREDRGEVGYNSAVQNLLRDYRRW